MTRSRPAAPYCPAPQTVLGKEGAKALGVQLTAAADVPAPTPIAAKLRMTTSIALKLSLIWTLTSRGIAAPPGRWWSPLREYGRTKTATKVGCGRPRSFRGPDWF